VTLRRIPTLRHLTTLERGHGRRDLFAHTMRQGCNRYSLQQQASHP
jgi:hypothetical protein